MSAMLTVVKLFVFITHMIGTNGQRTRFCDAGTDELFYENANNFSTDVWTWDNGGNSDNDYFEYDDPVQCYTGTCYAFYAWDNDENALMINPSFTSVAISTIDHWNIYIIFSVGTWQGEGSTGSCVTSYTVDNGVNFDPIHSAPSKRKFDWKFPNITRLLGTNAENINNVQIKLSTMNTNTTLSDKDTIVCYYDEILICGTVITPAPTSNTMPPTSNTVSPTSNTSPPSVSPTSDESLSDESPSDEVHEDESGSSDEKQMYAKQQDQNFIFDDTNNNVYKEKRIIISLSSSNVINVMAALILFACVSIVICVYYNPKMFIINNNN